MRKDNELMATVSTDNNSAASSTPSEEPAIASPTSPPEDPEKSKGKKAVKNSASSQDTIQLPEGLHILWTPDELPSEPLNPGSRKPLTIYLFTLHPQTQHRAAYPPPLAPSIEPTLALYCPIEGYGDAVIDSTVVELARQTNSEVLVLDAVQLAAGEWGYFGPASVSFDEENDSEPEFTSPQQMMLTVLAPARRGGSTTTVIKPKRPVPPSKVKVFFDSLINLPPSTSRPRLIYIRDFPTLASTSSAWYPYLRDAVSQRRKGAITRPTSPVSNPMTIILGMSPPLLPPPERLHPSGGSGIMIDWTESSVAEQAREKRLQQRLKSWEKGEDIVMDEYNRYSQDSDGSGRRRPEIIVVEGSGGAPSPFSMPGSSSQSSDDAEGPSFYRTSVLVPRVRSVTDEKDIRVLRRREINELTMRMAVGEIDSSHADVSLSSSPPTASSDPASPPRMWDDPKMWDAWGHQLESWSTVRQIADRAIGRVVASTKDDSNSQSRPTLERTSVSWSDIHRAWGAVHGALEYRKAWLRDSFSVFGRKSEDEQGRQRGEETEKEKFDEVVENVKNDPDIDPHEHRLLPTIVDAASMPTSFSQVHLPPHTIDSIRSIVSLPLLHPEAFQTGILKQHGMTDTLVVRALAKEAGCRMMVISPSDVMDMYVGEGEKLVHAVFSLARKIAPCVIFLDEIDALFGARMSARESGIITEFMQEMDGLKTSREDNVIVIGATNRPFDLDDAVLRRLPRRLLVDLPGVVERKEILKILLRDEVLNEDVDLDALAKKTESFSGSDLKHLCVSAALDAVKEGVKLPWLVSSSQTPETSDAISTLVTSEQVDVAREEGEIEAKVETSTPSEKSSLEDPPAQLDSLSPTRILSLRHFDKALKEITPSSSESLGSLADLRKWNEEFGEGMKDRKRKSIWGRDRFGFTDKDALAVEEGRVVTAATSSKADIVPRV
ncbi:AAA-domain-containing protein [Gymnopus androsaceus JB14]|uniref:AAA-domain-containing protein n=1 Tax=Gymnopus androsaceus JB14 TaxID=1447944 RepID=A0A6A4HQR9_9AGAR|nr:AAA-domain-containing protein [Gymnopus androsaceus JB14]